MSSGTAKLPIVTCGVVVGIALMMIGNLHGQKLVTPGYLFNQLSKTSIRVGDSTEVKVDVINISTVAGDVVAQIYIHQRYGTASRSVRQLKDPSASRSNQVRARLSLSRLARTNSSTGTHRRSSGSSNRPISMSGLAKILPPACTPILSSHSRGNASRVPKPA